jgi:hypothetical protein
VDHPLLLGTAILLAGAFVERWGHAEAPADQDILMQ